MPLRAQWGGWSWYTVTGLGQMLRTLRRLHPTTPGWRVTLGPTSPCLYAVAFLSCIGGNFQQLAVVPWLQEGTARPACVSWTMAGANLGAVRAQPQCALALTLGLTLALASAL